VARPLSRRLLDLQTSLGGGRIPLRFEEHFPEADVVGWVRAFPPSLPSIGRTLEKHCLMIDGAIQKP